MHELVRQSEPATKDPHERAVRRASTKGGGAPLPDAVREPIEQSSGFDLSSVRVDFDSAEPSALGARAFTRGTRIALAPGHERHLPHEAWHVVQQAQGRVRSNGRVRGQPLADQPALEREADRAASRIRRRGASSSLEHSKRPLAASASGPVQRVITGLEEIISPDLVPANWIGLYVQDVLDDTAHLWDEDIIAFLDSQDPTWHQQAELINTTGDHWDVRLIGRDPAVVIRTMPDGNCGCHAIHAVLHRQHLNQNLNRFTASRGTITAVRQFVQQRMQGDQNEVRKRIVLEVQRSPTAALTGFGPALLADVMRTERDALEHEDAAEASVAASSASPRGGDNGPPPLDVGIFKRFQRLLDAKVAVPRVREMMIEAKISAEDADRYLETTKSGTPAKSDGGVGMNLTDNEQLRQRVLALEQEMMDLVTFEIDEAQYLRDIQTVLERHLEPKQQALEKAASALQAALDRPEAGEDVDTLRARVGDLEREVSEAKQQCDKKYQTYDRASRKRIQAAGPELVDRLSESRLEWMKLMSQLVGTETAGKGESVKAPYHRHDAGPGAYGRTPTPEDAKVGHRRVEVLHGHGGWKRSGLLTEGALNPKMKGLTSLREILDAANENRKRRGLAPLKAENVDLAFLDHHGISIMGDRVGAGAYPRVMPLPSDLHKKVLNLIDAAKAQGDDPKEYILGKARRLKVNKQKKAYATQRGWEYTPDVEWTDRPLWEAFERVLAKTAGGEDASYVDVLSASEHADVRFPDSTLGDLMADTQNAERMSVLKHPDYKVTLLHELKVTKENVQKSWNYSATLSQAMTERLSEIEVGDRPVRVIWAACRADQWPKDFNVDMLCEWVKAAAEQRTKKRGW